MCSDTFCFICFDAIIRHQLHLTSDNEPSSKSILAGIILFFFPMTPSLASDGKKTPSLLNFFFQSCKLSKNMFMVLCNNWYCACSEILSYSSATFSRLRATRVVNSKLPFTGLFFYSLIILIKLCKIRYLKVSQSSNISKKPGYLSEKLKNLTSSNYHKV